MFKKPRGRPPKGKIWDEINGYWINSTNDDVTESLPKKAKLSKIDEVDDSKIIPKMKRKSAVEALPMEEEKTEALPKEKTEPLKAELPKEEKTEETIKHVD